MTAIDEIKTRIDIVDLVSESVQLRHTGKNYTGFCPFHPNSRTPAFVVFPETGTWRCFGQCNEGGDIFRFVMKKEGVDFTEALRMPGRACRCAAEAAQRTRSSSPPKSTPPCAACSKMRSFFTTTTCSIPLLVRPPWNTCTRSAASRTRPSKLSGWATPPVLGGGLTNISWGKAICPRICWIQAW